RGGGPHRIHRPGSRARQAQGAFRVSLVEGSSPSHDTEELLRRVIEIIEGTRTLPLSSSVKLDNKEEVLELLDEACQRLPDEMKQARWLLKERGEFLAKM